MAKVRPSLKHSGPAGFPEGDVAYPTDRVLGDGRLEAASISEVGGRRGFEA